MWELAAAFALQAAALPPWEIERDIDPISDFQSIQMALKINEAELRISCSVAHRRLVYVIVVSGPRFLGNAVERGVILRFDHDPPISRRWRYANSMAASPDDSTDIVDRMRQSSRLVVRLTDYNGYPADLIFPLETAGRALAVMDRQCATLPGR